MPQQTIIPAGMLARLKLFLALSRTMHGVIDMVTPILCALLWLGSLPGPGVAGLGLITVFAGYTAVYALNDLVDLSFDRTRMAHTPTEFEAEGSLDLDSALMRHPLAQGALSLKEGIIWTSAWAGLAMLGAWLLNPVCLLILLGAALLEVVYCLLVRISPFRTVINGLVKTAGPIAAVLAVDPRPEPLFLGTLFLCLFAWEVGGQNIPNDWTDMDLDRSVGARTMVVRYGTTTASILSLCTVSLALILSFWLFALSPLVFSGLHFLLLTLSGGILLLLPAFRLNRKQERQQAMTLFNLASFWPFSLFLIVLVKLMA
ncbi:MAG: UbiA family prenyltransferase [Desulfohalobiaceae bacterium]|nr:UbiA family prenyltransferase [Desulfohalobiaceae bacterium]